MDIIRNVSEIGSADRAAVEHLVGRQLSDNQQLIIRVVNVDMQAPPENGAKSPADDVTVPAWCNVLDGLSEQDLADFNATLAVPVRMAHAAE